MSKKTELWISIVVTVLFTGTLLGTNRLLNNRTFNEPGYCGVSFATGLNGHTEFLTFANGSVEVKVYPGIGHRLWDSDLFQDHEGNGSVDTMRRNGAEWKANRLSHMLVRSHDYQKNRELFDDADQLLKKLKNKHACTPTSRSE